MKRGTLIGPRKRNRIKEEIGPVVLNGVVIVVTTPGAKTIAALEMRIVAGIRATGIDSDAMPTALVIEIGLTMASGAGKLGNVISAAQMPLATSAGAIAVRSGKEMGIGKGAVISDGRTAVQIVNATPIAMEGATSEELIVARIVGPTTVGMLTEMDVEINDAPTAGRMTDVRPTVTADGTNAKQTGVMNAAATPTAKVAGISGARTVVTNTAVTPIARAAATSDR